MPKTNRPTRISDVARLAGVSVATVSRVLSNPEIVAETTRKTVERAVRDTGYTVNMTARNLRQQHTGVVLALVPNLANPFFSEILCGISQVLRREALSLFIVDTWNYPGLTLAPFLNHSRSDGVIVLDGQLDPALFTQPNCPPIVQACEENAALNTHKVITDNKAGSRQAILHLTRLNHRRILHLTGPVQNSLSIARRQGVEAGLMQAGIGTQEWLEPVGGDFSVAKGDQTAQDILAMTTPPTAVFCDSDEMALGLMGGLKRAGLDVPRDISVVGFDNIDLSRYCVPRLTSVRQYRSRIGSYAAELLLDERRQYAPQPRTHILPTELVVRESTAIAKA